jgi:hypothetical protein
MKIDEQLKFLKKALSTSYAKKTKDGTGLCEASHDTTVLVEWFEKYLK